MSTLVGVILLLLATATLAAMVSAIALSSSNIEQSKLVCVTVDRIAASTGPGTGIISVQNMGGMNSEMLQQGAPGKDGIKVFVNGVQASTVTYPAAAVSASYVGPQPGSIQYFQVDSGAEVIVVACYHDNTEYQVWTGAVP